MLDEKVKITIEGFASIVHIDGDGKHARFFHECLNEDNQYWGEVLNYKGFGGVRRWYCSSNSNGVCFYCPYCSKKLPTINDEGKIEI